MRSRVAALLVLWPCLAGAQPAATPGLSSGPALPPIGLPLPPIGLPLAPLGLGPATETRSPATPAAVPSSSPRRGGRHHRASAGPQIYLVPGYGVFALAAAPAVAAAPRTAPAETERATAAVPAATGTIRLNLSPRPTGPLFVNGSFVGTLEDLGDELTLVTGIHQLEVRQRGFKPFTLSVRIDAGRALVYTGELERDPQAPPAGATTTSAAAPADALPPPVRKPLYFIPGCYLGDVPPEEAGLPASCDLSRAVVYRP